MTVRTVGTGVPSGMVVSTSRRITWRFGPGAGCRQGGFAPAEPCAYDVLQVGVGEAGRPSKGPKQVDLRPEKPEKKALKTAMRK